MVSSERAVFILAEISLLIGSDGMSPSNLGEAMLASEAKVIGGDGGRPSEMYRRAT